MIFRKLIIYIMRHSDCPWSRKKYLPHRKNRVCLSASIVALIAWVGPAQLAAADQQPTTNLVKCIAKIMDLPIPKTTPHIRYIPQIQIEQNYGGHEIGAAPPGRTGRALYSAANNSHVERRTRG